MATISWISNSGGDWSTGANWQGGVVPGAADDAVMNLTAAETITVSTRQHVHSVAMSDTAASFLISASGALDATGDIVLSVGSASVQGAISSGGAITIESGQSAGAPQSRHDFSACSASPLPLRINRARNGRRLRDRFPPETDIPA